MKWIKLLTLWCVFLIGGFLWIFVQTLDWEKLAAIVPLALFSIAAFSLWSDDDDKPKNNRDNNYYDEY